MTTCCLAWFDSLFYSLWPKHNQNSFNLMYCESFILHPSMFDKVPSFKHIIFCSNMEVLTSKIKSCLSSFHKLKKDHSKPKFLVTQHHIFSAHRFISRGKKWLYFSGKAFTSNCRQGQFLLFILTIFQSNIRLLYLGIKRWDMFFVVCCRLVKLPWRV